MLRVAVGSGGQTATRSYPYHRLPERSRYTTHDEFQNFFSAISPSTMTSRFEDCSNALATGCTDRDEPADGLAGLGFLLGQLLGELRDDPPTRCCEGMARSQRRTVDVELGPVDRPQRTVQTEALLAVLLGLPGRKRGEHHRSERL